jgi:hypothetical protein
VLAPHAKLRAAVVPEVAEPASESPHEHAHCQAARMSWARRLKRVYEFERGACGGQLKILAAIEDPVVIVRILRHLHLGLSARASLRAPAREPEAGAIGAGSLDCVVDGRKCARADA